MLEGSFISLLVSTMRSARRRAASSDRQAREDRENLRHSEERFHSLVLNASDMIVVLDAHIDSRSRRCLNLNDQGKT